MEGRTFCPMAAARRVPMLGLVVGETRSRWNRSWTALVAALVAAGMCADLAGAECPPGRPRGERGDRLRVGFAPTAPFALPVGDDGQPHGFAIDLLRELAGREGWHLEMVQLSPDTLRGRIADCELDIGVVGVPVSAALATAVDFSHPYFSTVTTVVVRADDAVRAGPLAGESRTTRIAHAGLRGIAWGLVALGLLAITSWLLNAATGWYRRRGVRWRRADAAVNGPLAGLRWLWRSTTGRVLAALWIAVGLVLGTAGNGAAVQPLLNSDDPLRALVRKAAHAEASVGERYPDGDHIDCRPNAMRDCFRGFANGTIAAVAGAREVLCTHLVDLAIDGVVMREDLSVPEQYAYLLPPGSPLRRGLDRALLYRHEERGRPDSFVHCPGKTP
jgi:ABC-type amino acid transport substrate-binding protein